MLKGTWGKGQGKKNMSGKNRGRYLITDAHTHIKLVSHTEKAI